MADGIGEILADAVAVAISTGPPGGSRPTSALDSLKSRLAPNPAAAVTVLWLGDGRLSALGPEGSTT